MNFEVDLMIESSGLHEQDPVFRKVTLENEKMKAVVRDLKFHHDPVGEQLQLLD